MAVEAFRYRGKVYYHFADSFKGATARTICALAVYEELRMRCTAEYLKKHIEATRVLLNPSNGKIRLTDLALINNNLEERLNLAPFPDHVYKLASVIFFDETESPYTYDFVYNKKKIDLWKKDPEMLDFFLKMQFEDLMPYGNMPKESVKRYFTVTELIDRNHHQRLQDILSKKT